MNGDQNNNAVDLMNKIHAVGLYHHKGMMEALRVFPECKEFLERNKHRFYDDVKSELAGQLQQAGETKDPMLNLLERKIDCLYHLKQNGLESTLQQFPDLSDFIDQINDRPFFDVLFDLHYYQSLTERGITVDDQKREILSLIKRDLSETINAILTESRSKDLTKEKASELLKKVTEYIAGSRVNRFKNSSSNKLPNLEPEYSQMMAEFSQAMEAMKPALENKFFVLSKPRENNIDDKLEMLKESVYNSHDLDISAIQLLKETAIDLKLMLLDGRAWSSNTNSVYLLEGIQEKISELIKRKNEALDFSEGEKQDLVRTNFIIRTDIEDEVIQLLVSAFNLVERDDVVKILMGKSDKQVRVKSSGEFMMVLSTLQAWNVVTLSKDELKNFISTHFFKDNGEPIAPSSIESKLKRNFREMPLLYAGLDKFRPKSF